MPLKPQRKPFVNIIFSPGKKCAGHWERRTWCSMQLCSNVCKKPMCNVFSNKWIFVVRGATKKLLGSFYSTHGRLQQYHFVGVEADIITLWSLNQERIFQSTVVLSVQRMLYRTQWRKNQGINCWFIVAFPVSSLWKIGPKRSRLRCAACKGTCNLIFCSFSSIEKKSQFSVHRAVLENNSLK